MEGRGNGNMESKDGTLTFGNKSLPSNPYWSAKTLITKYRSDYTLKMDV